jgi:hypothetical protein
LLAASTQFCAADILELIGDAHGVELTRRYEAAYQQFFGMFCERARARHNGRTYMLESLLPEARGTADRLRARILDKGKLAPLPISALKGFLKGRRRENSRDDTAELELVSSSPVRLSF